MSMILEGIENGGLTAQYGCWVESGVKNNKIDAWDCAAFGMTEQAFPQI
jgi:hypothetical protein